MFSLHVQLQKAHRSCYPKAVPQWGGHHLQAVHDAPKGLQVPLLSSGFVQLELVWGAGMSPPGVS